MYNTLLMQVLYTASHFLSLETYIIFKSETSDGKGAYHKCLGEPSSVSARDASQYIPRNHDVGPIATPGPVEARGSHKQCPGIQKRWGA